MASRPIQQVTLSAAIQRRLEKRAAPADIPSAADYAEFLLNAVLALLARERGEQQIKAWLYQGGAPATWPAELLELKAPEYGILPELAAGGALRG